MKRIPIDEVPAVDFVRAAVGAPTSGDLGGQIAHWPRTRARAFTPTTLDLIEASLAKGVVLSVARRGGWRKARFIHEGEVREGRLWERHPRLELRFSAYAIQLVFEAVYGARPGDSAAPETGADEVFAYLAADLLRRRGRPAPPSLGQAVLPWLVAPDVMARTGRAPPASEAVHDMVVRVGPWLEGLQEDLTRAVVRVEHKKSKLGIDEVLALGAAQGATLNAYLDAVEARPDLGRFMVTAAARLAAGGPRAEVWRCADSSASLARRAEAGVAAGAFLAAVVRLDGWRARYAAVRFFEDDFDLAQLFLEGWADLGSEGYARLRAVAEALGAVRAVAPREDLS